MTACTGLLQQAPVLTGCMRCAVMPGTKLQEHSGSEKAWVYTTVDFADEEQKPELFCIRFASPESEHCMLYLPLLLPLYFAVLLLCEYPTAWVQGVGQTRI